MANDNKKTKAYEKEKTAIKYVYLKKSIYICKLTVKTKKPNYNGS